MSDEIGRVFDVERMPGIPGYTWRQTRVHGDGSCFFHTLAYLFNVRDYRSRFLDLNDVQPIVQALRCKMYNMKTPGNQIISPGASQKEYCSLRTWAYESMIESVRDKLGFNIFFWDADSTTFFCPHWCDRWDRPSIVVSWVNHAHFEPIYLVRDQNGEKIHMFCPEHEPYKQVMKLIMHHMGSCVLPATCNI